MMNNQVIHCISKIERTKQRIFTTTRNGDMDMSKYVLVNGIKLPELNPGRNVLRSFLVYIFQNEAVRYDIVMGRDFCEHLVINLNFEKRITIWIGNATKIIPWNHQSQQLLDIMYSGDVAHIPTNIAFIAKGDGSVGSSV